MKEPQLFLWQCRFPACVERRSCIKTLLQSGDEIAGHLGRNCVCIKEADHRCFAQSPLRFSRCHSSLGWYCLSVIYHLRYPSEDEKCRRFISRICSNTCKRWKRAYMYFRGQMQTLLLVLSMMLSKVNSCTCGKGALCGHGILAMVRSRSYLCLH